MPEAEQKYTSYRWVMLGLIWVIIVIETWVNTAIPPLAKQLMADLRMDHAMLMSVLGAPSILSIFLAIPGGILTDKFGSKKMILLSGLIAGVAGILRGTATSYLQFLIFSIAFGLGGAIRMPNFAKLVRQWFPSHQVGLATGIYSSAISVGYVVGLAGTYPMFGFNWRLAFIVINSLGLVAIMLWFLLARERKTEAGPSRLILSDLSKVVRNFDIWMCGLIRIFAVGGVTAFIGNFPLALQTVRFIDPATAGVVTSMNTVGAFIGNLFVPIISDRIRRRKVFTTVFPMLGAISLFLAWNLPFGILTFIFSGLTGLFIASPSVVTRIIVTEHPNVPPAIVGMAMGFYGMIQSGGHYIVTVSIGFLTDWKPGYDITFLVAALLMAVSVVFGSLVSETGGRKALAAGS